MGFIDMHCDTLMKTVLRDPPADLYQDKQCAVSFVGMREGHVLAQFFAVFMPREEHYLEALGRVMDDDEYIRLAVSRLHEALKKHRDLISFADSAAALEANRQAGKMSALLSMEDGRSVQGQLDKLHEYRDLGVRMISLTWNDENCFGFPNSADAEKMKRGLKPFGKEAITAMNEWGIIVDVSHLSDGGFADVAEISDKPFVASHSNCRSLTPHQRNLTDSMIRSLAEKGGVIGLNFCPPFLGKKTDSEGGRVRKSRIEDMVRHLNHLKNTGGEDVPALGTDFDGMSGDLEIMGSRQLPLLTEALRHAGWTARQIDKFSHDNVLRVLRDCL